MASSRPGTASAPSCSPRTPNSCRSAASALGSNTIAVLVGGLDPFYLPLLRGIEDVAAEHGMLVLIGDVRDSPAVADVMVRRLAARGMAGIIAASVGGVARGQGDGRRGVGRVPPTVYVDQPEKTGHVILFDGRAAGAAATRHLQDHGHHRIGIVTAPLAWTTVRQVYDGYAEALEERRDFDPALVSEVDEFSIEAGRIGLARLLDLDDPPTAVFAAGEVLAHGVLQEARARGVAVPDDLAIAGCTDSPVAALVEPPLTMVAVPAREMGERAMRVLAKLIAGDDPRPRRAVLGVELVVRQSCGTHERR